MQSFEKVFGVVLAEERRRAGMSQEELAFRARMHPTYVSQLERGLKSPTVRALQAIARALGTEGSELMRKAEERVN